MKMILAVINQDDANTVVNALMKDGFHATKLATTGGFLRAGNMTILVGTEDENVQTVIEIVRKHSHSRKQIIPATTDINSGVFPTMPVEVTVGGATLFIMNVEHCERV